MLTIIEANQINEFFSFSPCHYGLCPLHLQHLCLSESFNVRNCHIKFAFLLLTQLRMHHKVCPTMIATTLHTHKHTHTYMSICIRYAFSLCLSFVIAALRHVAFCRSCPCHSFQIALCRIFTIYTYANATTTAKATAASTTVAAAANLNLHQLQGDGPLRIPCKIILCGL